jgi:hypothetical protein
VAGLLITPAPASTAHCAWTLLQSAAAMVDMAKQDMPKQHDAAISKITDGCRTVAFSRTKIRTQPSVYPKII